MHTTKRPVGDIRIPMGCEEEKTLLTDIAYFNSLACKAIIRFCSQHVVNKNQAQKRPNPCGSSLSDSFLRTAKEMWP
jgi:hypothetical protein